MIHPYLHKTSSVVFELTIGNPVSVNGPFISMGHSKLCIFHINTPLSLVPAHFTKCHLSCVSYGVSGNINIENRLSYHEITVLIKTMCDTHNPVLRTPCCMYLSTMCFSNLYCEGRREREGGRGRKGGEEGGRERERVERGREREREVRGIRNIYKHQDSELDAELGANASGKNSEYQQNKLFCAEKKKRDYLHRF